MHRPDLLIVPGGATRVGLGLWNSLPATLILEFGFFIAGVVLYSRATAPMDRTGRYALWALLVLLTVLYLGSLMGPPPPSETAIAIVGIAAWLFVPWAYWIDRHRRAAVA